MKMNDEMADGKPKAGIKEQINENLRRVYEDALQEEVPDRFKRLLEQLKAKGTTQ